MVVTAARATDMLNVCSSRPFKIRREGFIVKKKTRIFYAPGRRLWVRLVILRPCVCSRRRGTEPTVRRRCASRAAPICAGSETHPEDFLRLFWHNLEIAAAHLQMYQLRVTVELHLGWGQRVRGTVIGERVAVPRITRTLHTTETAF